MEVAPVTCRELADFILDYRAGTLAPEIRRTFEEHLRVCPNCVQYLANYEATVELGRKVFEQEDREASEAGAPEDLVAAILSSRPRS